jgi:hypothetical protein
LPFTIRKISGTTTAATANQITYFQTFIAHFLSLQGWTNSNCNADNLS